MDALVLGFYLVATFVGGLTSGFAGFAFGLIVSGVWLHFLSPLQTAILTASYGLFSQGYGVWKLRRSLNLRLAAPFIIGSAIGVPIGTLLLTTIDPASLRVTIGVLLVVYGIYGLARPTFIVRSVPPADIGIGVLNGILGGLTGLAGIVVTVWCQFQGWPKDKQRTVFQPVLFFALTMSAISLSIGGGVSADSIRLFLYGLPFLFAGLWCGFKLYGKANEAMFRKAILVLLLLSGAALIVPMR
jgi:hypothetical protein